MEREFPSNRRYINAPAEKKEEPAPEKLQAVVRGGVERRKKPIGKRWVETFLGGDARSVWDYVTLDVLLPAAKDMFTEAVSQGVERMVFGEARSTSRSRPRGGFLGGPPGHTAYDRVGYRGGSRRDEPRREMSLRARSLHDFDEIILNTRAEGETVLERLDVLIENYGVAKVSDLYALTGIQAAFTDEKYGWDDLRSARVERMRGGKYLLSMPEPSVLD